MAVTLAPMWKCTGSWRPLTTSQNGSQARFGKVGGTEVLGIGGHVHAAHPEGRHALAPPTMHRSMSHAGMRGIGRRRLFDADWISAMPSL